jgi:hypothetical protein
MPRNVKRLAIALCRFGGYRLVDFAKLFRATSRYGYGLS